MGKAQGEGEMRAAVARHLRSKGYEVIDLSAGSGVPKLSRIQIERGTEKLTCAVKTTTGGRISFTRNADGTYKVLSEVDRVIHVTPLADDEAMVRVSMFDSARVLTAFEQNHAALNADGKGHLPAWLNPDHEPGPRFVGSGYGKDALWSEVVPVSTGPADHAGQPSTTEGSALPGSETTSGIMDRIKMMLSQHMGVRPDQLEIDVRVRH